MGKKVLIITNKFCPDGHNQRARRMADRKDLMKEHGWVAHFLVADKNEQPIPKDNLTKGYNLNYAITFNTYSEGLLRFGFVQRFINTIIKAVRLVTRKLLIPDEYAFYIVPMYFIARKIIIRKKIHVVITMNRPFSFHIVGLLLKRTLNIPWLAEFRDGWVTNPNIFKGKKNSLHQFLEGKVVHASDRVVWNYGVQIPEKYFSITYPKERSEKFIKLPSPGFDGFNFSKLMDINPYHFNVFTITYAGTFCKDILTPEIFLKGLSIFITRNHIDSGSMRVNFFGDDISHYDSLIDKLHLRDFVFYLGKVPYRTCLEYLSGSDVNLVINRRGPGDELNVPAKVTDYISIGRPILALTEEKSEIRQFINENKLGRAVSFDEEEISEGIRQFYLDSIGKKNGYPFQNEFITQFDSRAIFKQYCKILDELIHI